MLTTLIAPPMAEIDDNMYSTFRLRLYNAYVRSINNTTLD